MLSCTHTKVYTTATVQYLWYSIESMVQTQHDVNYFRFIMLIWHFTKKKIIIITKHFKRLWNFDFNFGQHDLQVCVLKSWWRDVFVSSCGLEWKTQIYLLLKFVLTWTQTKFTNWLHKSHVQIQIHIWSKTCAIRPLAKVFCKYLAKISAGDFLEAYLKKNLKKILLWWSNVALGWLWNTFL